MDKKKKKHKSIFDEPTQSDATLLLKVEDLINIAMGPADQNIVNFKMIQTVLFILARQMRMLETKVELRVGELKNEASMFISRMAQDRELESSEESLQYIGGGGGPGEADYDQTQEGRKGGGKKAKDRVGEQAGWRPGGGGYEEEGAGGGRRAGAAGGPEEDYGPDGGGGGGRRKRGPAGGAAGGGADEAEWDEDEGQGAGAGGMGPKKGRRGAEGGTGVEGGGWAGGGQEAGGGRGAVGQRASGTSIAVSEKKVGKDKVLVVGKGEGGVGGGGRSRVGSIEVVTAKEFAILEAAVKAMQDKVSLPPAPMLPDNKKLRSDIAKGSASLTDTMQAMQLGSRVLAAEKAIGNMAELLTALASTGVLPQDIAIKAAAIQGDVQAMRQEMNAMMGPGGGPGGPWPGGPGGGWAAGPGGGWGPGPDGQLAIGPGGGPGGPGGTWAGGPGGPWAGGPWAGGPGGPGGAWAGGPGGPGGPWPGGQEGPGGAWVGGPGGPGGPWAGGPGGPGGPWAGGPGGPGGPWAGGPGGPGGPWAGGPGGPGGPWAGGPGSPGGPWAGGPGGPGGPWAGGPGGPGGPWAGGPGGPGGPWAGGPGGPGGPWAGGPGGPGGPWAGGPGGPGGPWAGGPGGPGGPWAGGPGGPGGPWTGKPGEPGGPGAGGPGGPGGPWAGGPGGPGGPWAGWPGGLGGPGGGPGGVAGGPGGGVYTGLELQGPSRAISGISKGPGGQPSVYSQGRGQAGLAALLPPNMTAVTHADLDGAMAFLRDDIVKNMQQMTQRANTTADNAAASVKHISEKIEIAFQVDTRISFLMSMVNDYAEQLAGFDNGLTTQMNSFQDQMVTLRAELQAGLTQLEQVNNNAETAAVLELTERYEGLVSELDNTLHSHQGLTTFQRQLTEELKSLVEAVEMMREQKADRDEVLDGLRDKADSTRLAGLLSEADFQEAREQLEMRIQMCYDKFRRQDAVWMNVMNDFGEIVESKAELTHLLGVREEAQDQLQDLHWKVQQLAKLLGDPKAAVLIRKLAKDATCAVCRVPALMEPIEPIQPIAMPFAKPPLPEDLGEQPCMRHFNLKDTMGPEVPRLEPHMCNRWTGGSHTLIGAPLGLGTVTHEVAPPAVAARPVRRYLGQGVDGKLYKLEEDFIPCAECNIEPELSKEKIPGEADAMPVRDGSGDQGAAGMSRVTVVDPHTAARRVTVVDDANIRRAVDASELKGDELGLHSSHTARRSSISTRRSQMVAGEDDDHFPKLQTRQSRMDRSAMIMDIDAAAHEFEVGQTISGHVTTVDQDNAQKSAIKQQISEDKAIRAASKVQMKLPDEDGGGEGAPALEATQERRASEAPPPTERRASEAPPSQERRASEAPPTQSEAPPRTEEGPAKPAPDEAPQPPAEGAPPLEAP